MNAFEAQLRFKTRFSTSTKTRTTGGADVDFYDNTTENESDANGQIVVLDQISTQLDQCTDVMEIKNIRDKAEAVRSTQKRQS